MGLAMVHSDNEHTSHVVYQFNSLHATCVVTDQQEKQLHSLYFLGLRRWCVVEAPSVVSLGHQLLGHIL